MSLNIYEAMEDWDDPDLPEEDWREQMKDVIIQYYEEYPDTPPMSLKNRISNYKSWKREKYAPEQ